MAARPLARADDRRVVLLDGRVLPELSDLGALPAGVRVTAGLEGAEEAGLRDRYVLSYARASRACGARVVAED